jgi:hypothetical protein
LHDWLGLLVDFLFNIEALKLVCQLDWRKQYDL